MNRKDLSYVSPHILASLDGKTPVLLAFSGGADSSALLHLLVNDSKKHGFPLSVAHFHHGIRGEEADRDANFCRSVAKQYNLSFYLEKADIPSLAKANKTSVEAEARAQRYAFFERIMRENDIPILVTAHHAEDNIESILINIVRGCGIAGLKGILPHRAFYGDLHLVRPILKAQKQDVLDYCDENHLQFVYDSTNGDKTYLRNAIRSDVTPKLQSVQPNLTDMFFRLSQSASEADSFINSVASEFIESECKNGEIPLDKLLSMPSAPLNRIISMLFEGECGATLERVHVEAVVELCKKGVPHSSISLPSSKSARIENERLVFCDGCKSDESNPFSLPFFEGERRLDNGTTIKIEKNPSCKASKNSVFLDVKCDAINSSSHFRSRREGDTILTKGMHKRVKKLLNEKNIPISDRSNLPFLVSNEEILWIPTVAACDTVKSDKIKDGDDFFRITITFDNN